MQETLVRAHRGATGYFVNYALAIRQKNANAISYLYSPDTAFQC